MVFPALEEFSEKIKEFCLLSLQVVKTEVFSWENTLPPEVPDSMRRAGTMVAGQWVPGFMCYGIAVGKDEYVRQKLKEKVDEVVGVVEAVKGVLGPHKDRQALWTVLQCSLAQKLDWHLTLNYPSDIAAAGIPSRQGFLGDARVCWRLPHPHGRRGSRGGMCAGGSWNFPPTYWAAPTRTG